MIVNASDILANIWDMQSDMRFNLLDEPVNCILDITVQRKVAS